MERDRLDPWRVILHRLFDVDSRDIPRILDRTGLAVNWNLSSKEDFSHKMRLTAYRPRILEAYEALDEDDQLRIAYVVAQSLPEAAAESLARDLQNIGWKIEEGRLAPNSAAVSELFFPIGTQHDAYVKIRDIFRQARHSITVVDAYVDETIFDLLASRETPLDELRILTLKHPTDLALEASKFQAQYPEVRMQIRKTKVFHDRFVVVDATQCWHLGASIKDAGMKAFMISQVEGEQNRDVLLKQIEQSWESAEPIDESSGEIRPRR